MSAQNRASKSNLHPRNKHRKGYNFEKLIKDCPALKSYVRPNAYGNLSINFFDPAAVKALNQALLLVHYNIHWDIPEGYLCPPVPGRADYVHYVADLLARDNRGLLPKAAQIRCLDVGVGANCIYPILGHQIYAWSFLGSDIHAASINAARQIIEKNGLSEAIRIRLQANTRAIFQGVLPKGERFAVTFCNPPFHDSEEEAREAATRKLRNLGAPEASKLNFAGQAHELWCAGGALEFIQKMIKESQVFAKQCLWFTTLVSKEAHLECLLLDLKKVQVETHQLISMGQGNKRSRILAWTFLPQPERRAWMNEIGK